MENKEDGKGAWEDLRAKLEEEGGYPKIYFFKFIVPGDNRSIARLESLFGEEAQVNLRMSKNGKYASLSVKEMMLDTHSIIERYEEAMQIDGCMAL